VTPFGQLIMLTASGLVIVGALMLWIRER